MLALPSSHRLHRSSAPLVLCLVTGGLRAAPVGPPPSTISPETEAAVLAERWEEVIRLLPVDARIRDPVSRLLGGHASLALNRGNDALEAFLGSSEAEATAAWRAWTQDLSRRRPDSPTAHYLEGDARAREPQWKTAVESFDRALALDPRHVLSLHARGVCRAAREDWDEALKDLSLAREMRPDLADVHASLGALWIQRRQGTSGALRSFRRALEIAPDHALALYSRACLGTVLGRWKEVEEDLGRLGGDERLSRLLGPQLLSLVEALSDHGTEVAHAPGDNPQARIDRNLQKIRDSGPGSIGGPLNAIVNDLAASHDRPDYDDLRRQVTKGLADIAIKDPVRAAQMSRQIQRIEATNSLLGSVERALFQPRSQTRTQEIELTAGISGSAGLKPGHKGGLGAGVDGDLGIRALERNQVEGTAGRSLPMQWLDNSVRKRGIAVEIQGELRARGVQLPDAPQGFTTTLPEDSVDGGDWPFQALYGLAYPSSGKEEKAQGGRP